MPHFSLFTQTICSTNKTRLLKESRAKNVGCGVAASSLATLLTINLHPTLPLARTDLFNAADYLKHIMFKHLSARGGCNRLGNPGGDRASRSARLNCSITAQREDYVHAARRLAEPQWTGRRSKPLTVQR